MKQNILFLLSICMLLLTCSDGNDPIKEIENKDPFITLKKTNIDFTNEGGSDAILIESNVTWTAKSSASWCTVSPSSGNKSTASITLSASVNKDYDNRSCTVTLEGGSLTKTITVNQGENLGLLITQDRYELSNEESSIKVEVKANVEFEVEINDEWISKVDTRGLTTSQIEFKIAENDTYGNRNGSITIKQKGGGMTSTITIFQSQEDAIILSKKDFDISSEAQSVEVEVKTNIDYEIIIPEDAKDWVSHASTRALRTETVVLDIAENKDYDERTAKITIKDKKTNMQETVTIKQVANTGLIVSTDKHELSNDGGTIEVEVKANVEFEIEIADSWITRVETRGLTTTNLTFAVAKNESYSNREGTITISQTDGDLSSTITVYQSKENALILSEKEVEVSDRSQTLDVVIKTNVDFDVTIKEDGKDWVSYTPTRGLREETVGLREETVSLNISANSSDKARSTEVYIKDKLTNLQEALTITQIGKEPGVYYVERMGTLGSTLNQTQKDTITTMIVKGEINKADFDVMKSQMPKLKYVDLKEVKCEGDRIPEQAFYHNQSITKIVLPNDLTSIGGYAFFYCKELYGKLDIPKGVNSIGDYAFYGCDGLHGYLDLPDGLISIGDNAFEYCDGFTGALDLPKGLLSIGESAFQYCEGFTGSLKLPDGITFIGDNAFMGTYGLSGSVEIPGSLKTVGKIGLHHYMIETLTINEGITTIKESAFYGMHFTNLSLPNSLKIIEAYAFDSSKNLTGTLIIPDGVTTIGRGAFSICFKITGLELGENVEVIDEMAFLGGNFSGKVVFPESIKSIKKGAFDSCDKVEAFRLPHTTPLRYYSKMFPEGATVEVPQEAVETYKSTYGWKDYNIVGY